MEPALPTQQCPNDEPEPPPSTANSHASPNSASRPPCPRPGRATLASRGWKSCAPSPAPRRREPVSKCPLANSASRASTSGAVGTRNPVPAARGARRQSPRERGSFSTMGAMGISGCSMTLALRTLCQRASKRSLARTMTVGIGMRTGIVELSAALREGMCMVRQWEVHLLGRYQRENHNIHFSHHNNLPLLSFECIMGDPVVTFLTFRFENELVNLLFGQRERRQGNGVGHFHDSLVEMIAVENIIRSISRLNS